jgi:hypothetical protein
MTAAELRTMAVRTRRGAAHGLRAFYARPVGWAALLVTSLFLSYGGGGVMFWFHAVYRGEDGPPIPDVWHWLFDSTLGFLALTPALFFIMPLALHLVERAGIGERTLRGTARVLGPARVKAALYVGAVGVLFGVVAGPGPLLHGVLVGRDSPLGRLAVALFGTDPGVAARNAEAVAHTPVSSVLLQLAVGIPVYIAFGLLALAVVRAMARRTAGE